ncbi:mycothiol system anti-sigma-R factor [Nakamurella antarctica]|uniref:Mycothiol system anti-sigma-R factor n=1 Tax=Nakamurella antarctica TaxID=1902245 RepID=A0A3G8ZL40_9ACTN|nr:mycothiol system anti-sigma-R factor [Nakamurella antarctica]AZI57497.1 mycothiol system anti-sigma-R factor [Nakamurella antarctica]
MTTHETSALPEPETVAGSGHTVLKPECLHVLSELWVFLDNELDPDERARMRAHLDDCPPCLDHSDVGEKLKALLHRKCGGDAAPEVLREKLLQALKAGPPR